MNERCNTHIISHFFVLHSKITQKGTEVYTADKAKQRIVQVGTSVGHELKSQDINFLGHFGACWRELAPRTREDGLRGRVSQEI